MLQKRLWRLLILSECSKNNCGGFSHYESVQKTFWGRSQNKSTPPKNVLDCLTICLAPILTKQVIFTYRLNAFYIFRLYLIKFINISFRYALREFYFFCFGMIKPCINTTSTPLGDPLSIGHRAESRCIPDNTYNSSGINP